MRPYGVLMSPRKLLAILIALAVLLAPAFSRLGEASAALPHDHQMQMIEGGHCQSLQPSPDDHDKAPAQDCCVAMCMGVALGAPDGLQVSSPTPAPATYVVRPLHLSYLGEIATPPPKVA
jgi:hypothetical protein